MIKTKSRKKNIFIVNGPYAIGLDENSNEFYFDTCDMALVVQCYWGVHRNGYVHGCINSKTISLHRYLMNPSDGIEVDHINHVHYDCRRSNLRICNRNDNAKNQPIQSSNTSGYRGVDFHSCRGLWRARIRVDGRRIDLGHFKTAERASDAYKYAATKYHGEFASF